jgi:hypothetical protein
MNFAKIITIYQHTVQKLLAEIKDYNYVNCQIIRELQNFKFTAIGNVIPLAEVLVR